MLNNSITFLFQDPRLAKELAFALSGDWDGLNSVCFQCPIDQEAFRLVIALANRAEESGLTLEEYCCSQGDSCKFPSTVLFEHHAVAGLAAVTLGGAWDQSTSVRFPIAPSTAELNIILDTWRQFVPSDEDVAFSTEEILLELRTCLHRLRGAADYWAEKPLQDHPLSEGYCILGDYCEYVSWSAYLRRWALDFLKGSWTLPPWYGSVWSVIYYRGIDEFSVFSRRTSARKLINRVDLTGKLGSYCSWSYPAIR